MMFNWLCFCPRTVYRELPVPGDFIKYFCQARRDIQPQSNSSHLTNQPFY